MFVWQTLHDIFHGHYILMCRRRLSHDGGGIWREAKWIHLWEVDGCVLTWAREDDDSEQVIKLVSGFDRRREAMFTFTFSDWIAVVMEITNPGLELCVLWKDKVYFNHGIRNEKIPVLYQFTDTKQFTYPLDVFIRMIIDWHNVANISIDRLPQS